MFLWQPQMVSFMRDASEYSDYDEKLAKKIAGYLPQDAHVCDAGCGLGYLSLALSKYVAAVTAVDISADALDVLGENMLRANAMNIYAQAGDIKRYSPARPYDAMIFCFFCNTEETLAIAKAQCAGNVILIKKNSKEHRFSIGHHLLDRFSFTMTCQELNDFGIPFLSEEFTLQLGQPFRCIEDAVLFFQTYSRDDHPEMITAEHIRGQLIEDPAGRYPYYLPAEKQLGLIVIFTDDIPEVCHRAQGWS